MLRQFLCSLLTVWCAVEDGRSGARPRGPHERGACSEESEEGRAAMRSALHPGKVKNADERPDVTPPPPGKP